jgi:two-component system sensor histidine kinase BaeS
MRLGITAKLFSAVLASCAVVLLVYGVTAEISFQRGFLGYLNEQGSQRMETVLPRLENAYRLHGNWDFLRGDVRGWFALLPPEHDPARKKIGPPISDQTGATNRFALLNPAYEVVIGHPAADREAILRPIVVDGHTVGWLAMVQFEKVIGADDMRFYKEQRRMWWLIGAFSIVIAAILAGLMSRAFLRRLHELAAATQRLLSGHYATRVRTSSRDELGELGRDFNRMAAALAHNEGARRNFMADISHELRTPLAVIRAEVEGIQDGFRPMHTDSLVPLDEQLHRLERLIDDLHDLSLTDVGTLSYRRVPLDLTTLLNATLLPMRERFAAAELRLQWTLAQGPLRIHGDERRLHQLFANLLENALRYTDAGGKVEVQCARGQDGFTITFDDSAPAVDAQKLPRLFERFYRVETAGRHASRGSGLGLAICRNIAAAHEGRIEATVSSLGGLRITVTLPEAA